MQWACSLGRTLGVSELSTLLPVVIRNVECAVVLAEILRTFCSVKPHQDANLLLRQLLEATIACFVSTTHSRLTSISPRHYNEFIDFLAKARETFLLSPDGATKFVHLVDTMRANYKGKKKLMALIEAKFGISG